MVKFIRLLGVFWMALGFLQIFIGNGYRYSIIIGVLFLILAELREIRDK